MAPARPAAPVFFPLDEQLALLPGSLSPWLQEALVRLSTHIPSFAKASRELVFFTGVQLHPDTARRRTEQAGAVLVAHETTEAERVLREHPAAPCTPDTLLISVDGAMVPLVHGQWTEVRTLTVGEVQPPEPTPDGPVVHTTSLSYFSRRTDSISFGELASLELHRRGIEAARRVGAVVDGAVWCQSFVDLHYPEAVRVLDFAHAAEYLARIAQTVGAEGPLLSATEHSNLRHALKHEGPEVVLVRLREVVASQTGNDELNRALAYLEARLEQMQYPQFVAAGWPIGSGMVESANKLVVEQRLKGAGMHWQRVHVNPLLALRTVACGDRWDDAWPQITTRLWTDRAEQQRARRRLRQAGPPQPPRPHLAPTIVGGRPTREHPWKKYPLLTGSRPYTERAKM
jgi:hypothetical protein